MGCILLIVYFRNVLYCSFYIYTLLPYNFTPLTITQCICIFIFWTVLQQFRAIHFYIFPELWKSSNHASRNLKALVVNATSIISLKEKRARRSLITTATIMLDILKIIGALEQIVFSCNSHFCYNFLN